MIRDPLLIDSRDLPRGEELRVELSDYRGFTYIGLRRWYRNGDGFAPGKGLSMRATMIPWLRRVLEQAEARALELGLLDEESYEACGLPVPAEITGAAAA